MRSGLAVARGTAYLRRAAATASSRCSAPTGRGTWSIGRWRRSPAPASPTTRAPATWSRAPSASSRPPGGRGRDRRAVPAARDHRRAGWARAPEGVTAGGFGLALARGPGEARVPVPPPWPLGRPAAGAAEWVEASTADRVAPPEECGYLWWLDRADGYAFMAGLYGQLAVVAPRRDLVAVVTAHIPLDASSVTRWLVERYVLPAGRRLARDRPRLRGALSRSHDTPRDLSVAVPLPPTAEAVAGRLGLEQPEQADVVAVVAHVGRVLAPLVAGGRAGRRGSRSPCRAAAGSAGATARRRGRGARPAGWPGPAPSACAPAPRAARLAPVGPRHQQRRARVQVQHRDHEAVQRRPAPRVRPGVGPLRVPGRCG